MNHWAKRALQGAVLAGGIWVIGAGIASAASTPSVSPLTSSILPSTTPVSAASSTLGGVVSDVPPAHPVTGITETGPGLVTNLLQQVTAAVPGGTSTAQNLVQRVANLAAGANTLPLPIAGAGLAPVALDGTTANAPVTAPVTITDNAVGVGQPATGGDLEQAPVTTSANPDNSSSSSSSFTSGTSNSADNDGNGAGSALLGASDLSGDVPDAANAPVDAPVLACGNAVGVLSAPSASCGDTGAGSSSNGPDGTFANAPITAPISVTGNAVAIGLPNALGGIGTGTGAGTGSASGTGTTGSGTAGSGSGTGDEAADIANAPITAPVTVCGNTIGILGALSAGCGSGNQASAPSAASIADIAVPVNAPATVCGNAVGVLGGAGGSCFAAAGGSTTGSGGGTAGGGSGGGVITAPGSGGTTGGTTGGGSGGGVITAPGSGSLPGGASTIGQQAVLVSNTASGKPLAFTGSDLQAVLALALALLNVGTTLILAGRPRRARRGKHARLVSLG